MNSPKENIILGLTSVALLLLCYFFEKQLPFTIFQASVVINLLIVPLGKWLIVKKLNPQKS